MFAEAKSDPNVGYALSPVAVAARAMPAVGTDEGGRDRGVRPLTRRGDGPRPYDGRPHAEEDR